MSFTDEQMQAMVANLDQHRLQEDWFDFGPPLRKIRCQITSEKPSKFRTVYHVRTESGSEIITHDTGKTCDCLMDRMLEALDKWDIILHMVFNGSSNG